MCDEAYSAAPSLTNPSRQLEAIEDRHVQVHERDIRKRKLEFVQRLCAVVGNSNIVAAQAKHFCK
jgi:hypothetical protein